MKLHKIITPIVICVTILVGMYFLSKTGFAVRDVNPQRVNETTVTNSIAVQGQGKVYATPDTAILRFRIASLKPTSAEAQDEVNRSLLGFNTIMKKYGIEKKYIQTQNLMIDAEYHHNYGDERTLKGYEASQSVKVIIRDIADKTGMIGKLINAVAQMDGKVAIQGMHYDIWDKTEYYTQARKLAMKKAEQKSDELADLAGLSKDKPLAISENSRSSHPFVRNAWGQSNIQQMDESLEVGDESDGISLGTMEIVVNVDVVYGVK